MQQKTAMQESIDLIKKDFETNNRLRPSYVFKILNEGLVKEKEQIEDSYYQAKCSAGGMGLEFNIWEKESQDYFNETYKK